MKKLLWAGITILVVAGSVFGLYRLGRSHALKLDTNYQALLLDNGQAYYGRIQQTDSELTVLADVYYVQTHVDPQTKESTSILIRRGNEWHAPNQTIINTRHIVIMEPVTPGSKVAQLISQLKDKSP